VKIVLHGAGGDETLETDANGRFKHSARPGRYTLLFRGEDGGLILRSYMLDGDPKDDLEFALKEPGAVAVKILRGKDGVGGADVVLTSREVGELATYTLATDTQGTALFENLIPGRYDVQAQVRDGPLAKAQAYAPAAETRDVKLLVPDGVVLRGTVRAGDRGPGVGAARITLETLAKGSQGYFETVFETQADGTFELTVPKGRPRNFLVEAEGHAPWPDARLRSKVLRSLRGLARKGPVVREIVLKGGAQLRGVVQDETKEPLPGIQLQFRMRRGPTVAVTTEDDGTYVVENLNPGAYDLQVETPGYFPIAGQKIRAWMPGGREPRPVTFDVTLIGARRLEGVVVDGAGKGVGGVRVWIVGGGRVVRSARNAGRELEVFTQQTGAWSITDIPPDKNVIVRAAMGLLEADPVPAPWQHPPPSPIRMTLRGTGTLRGTVVDLATREPIARARVLLRPDPYDGRTGRTIFTDAQGAFHLERILPGGWKLTPYKKGYLVAQPRVVTLARDGESVVTMELDPGEVFAGVVQSEAGVPLRYARVRVRGRPEGVEKDVIRAVNTNAQGLFRMTGFRRGVYELAVYRTGFKTERLRGMSRGDENLRFILRKK